MELLEGKDLLGVSTLDGGTGGGSSKIMAIRASEILTPAAIRPSRWNSAPSMRSSAPPFQAKSPRVSLRFLICGTTTREGCWARVCSKQSPTSRTSLSRRLWGGCDRLDQDRQTHGRSARLHPERVVLRQIQVKSQRNLGRLDAFCRRVPWPAGCRCTSTSRRSVESRWTTS